MRLMVRSVAVLAVAMFMLSASARRADTADAIVIAGSFDLSGSAADVGKDVLDGVQYAIDVLNERGGVLGRRLELRHQDNGTTPQKAVEQATTLLRDGAKFLLSPQSSASAIAVSKLVSGKLRIPDCINSSNSDDITIKDYQPYVFELGPNSYMEMKAVATRLAKEPYRRYAVISADYAGGRANANRFKEFMKELNPEIQIVVEEYPKFGATDYTASINKVLAAKPDYVWTVLFGADLITFSKQAQAVGFFEQMKNHFMALYDGNTLKALGQNAATGTDGWQRAPFSLLAQASREGKDYVNGFKAKNGRYPSDWSTLAYECVAVWAQAAEAARSVEADAVMAAIAEKEFHSLRGALRFGRYDHQGEVPVYIGKVVQDKVYAQPLLNVTDIIPGAKVRPTEETVRKLRGGG
jgi:branched-chain amino acid transport system substrate-binding protein